MDFKEAVGPERLVAGRKLRIWRCAAAQERKVTVGSAATLDILRLDHQSHANGYVDLRPTSLGIYLDTIQASVVVLRNCKPVVAHPSGAIARPYLEDLSANRS